MKTNHINGFCRCPECFAGLEYFETMCETCLSAGCLTNEGMCHQTQTEEGSLFDSQEDE